MRTDSETPSDEPVVYTVDPPVAVIRLNRPDRYNALNNEVLARLRESVRDAEANPDVVGIVLTGTGKAFSSGWDTESLADDVGPNSTLRRLGPDDPTPEMFSYLLDITKPVIAAVNGVAVAGGLVLAVLADRRFADPSARFATVFARRGLIAEHGSSWVLPRLVGLSKALDLLFTGRMVDATEALSLGLIDQIARDDVLEEACAYVRLLAETVAPESLRVTKQLVYRQLGDYDAAVREAWNTMIDSFSGPDPEEGARAFVERRPPNFRRVGARSAGEGEVR
jgi:enoyl-CoA hydratase/carnithine racemase